MHGATQHGAGDAEGCHVVGPPRCGRPETFHQLVRREPLTGIELAGLRSPERERDMRGTHVHHQHTRGGGGRGGDERARLSDEATGGRRPQGRCSSQILRSTNGVELDVRELRDAVSSTSILVVVRCHQEHDGNPPRGRVHGQHRQQLVALQIVEAHGDDDEVRVPLHDLRVGLRSGSEQHPIERPPLSPQSRDLIASRSGPTTTTVWSDDPRVPGECRLEGGGVRSVCIGVALIGMQISQARGVPRSRVHRRCAPMRRVPESTHRLASLDHRSHADHRVVASEDGRACRSGNRWHEAGIGK